MDSHPRKMWLANHVKFVTPKRRYGTAANEDNETRRQYTREFFLSVDGKLIAVCKKMFCQLTTLGFSTDKVIRTLQQSTNDCDVVRTYNRGGGGGGGHPPKQAPAEDHDFLMQHIKKFSPCISHYRRLYLPSELDVAEMYEDYKTCTEESGRKCLGYITYWRQVNILIIFAKLVVEECEVCDEYKIHITERSNKDADSADVVRKKSKKSNDASSTAGEEKGLNAGAKKKDKKKVGISKRCPEKREICNMYAAHTEQKILSLGNYSEDNAIAKMDKDTLSLVWLTNSDSIAETPRIQEVFIHFSTHRLQPDICTHWWKRETHNFGVLWHDEIAGRNISSGFNIFEFPQFRDIPKWVILVDNCGGGGGGANKCWTLFTMLVALVSRSDNCLEFITLKSNRWSHLHERRQFSQTRRKSHEEEG